MKLVAICGTRAAIVCWCRTMRPSNYWLEALMHCKKCNGYGFYTELDKDGNRQGRKCDHKVDSKKLLNQDLDIFSGMSRQHNS